MWKEERELRGRDGKRLSSFDDIFSEAGRYAAIFFIIIIISVWRQHEIDVVSKIGASPAQFVYGFLEHFVASGNGP